MNYILSLHFIESIFDNEKVLVGKIKDTPIFIRVSKNKRNKDSEASDFISWYYGEGIPKEIPFVDVLDLVSEETSTELIFNINVFNNKGV